MKRLSRVLTIISLYALIIVCAWGALLWGLDQYLPDIEVVGASRIDYWGVAPGDSLWSIARANYPDLDPREAVYLIRQANPDVRPEALPIGHILVMPEVE